MNAARDLFDLSQRVAVVTGGAGLLGAEFCQTLAQARAVVVVADVESGKAKEVSQRLQSQGLESSSIAVDVRDKESVERMVAQTLKERQRLDILVNCAALDPKFDPAHAGRFGDSFEELAESAWDQSLEVNLKGVFLCCQAVADSLRKQAGGVIINLGSTYGLAGPDQRIYQRMGKPPQFKPAAYSATKAGVLGLTRYLAAYFAGTGIRVNALTPGGVWRDHDPEFVEKYAARTMLGRMARQDEMNGALLFLASDASSYMTGANLVVDGGWTAW